MRAIWKGSISFGLVNIPVSLVPATKREQEVHFRLLRAKDLSPIDYKRVAETDGREVPWSEIVKGYEYEKGKFVVLKEEDFKRVDVEATETVDIVQFVDLAEINPMYFKKPYYLEPLKGGAGAYALLRDVLQETGKAGIAKVVIKTRQHLAALKPDGQALVLELMHFAAELVESDELKLPEQKTQTGKREIAMARALVDQMTEPWEPKRYSDDYTSALMRLIERKIEQGGKALPAARHRAREATNVIDLVSVLERSLAGTRKKPPAKKKSRAKRKPSRRRAVA